MAAGLTAGDFCRATHLALGELAATVRAKGLRGAGDTPDEAEWRTEIGWPIFRADGPD